MISKKEVQHIAKLARLGLTEKEIEKFQRELSSILNYIEKLKEVDISKAEPAQGWARREMRTKFSARIEPTSHSILMENVMRDDESQKSKVKSQKLMELAPETKNGYLKVKSIF